MLLNHLANEGEHRFERKALLKDLSPAASNRTHLLPGINVRRDNEILEGVYP